MNTKAGPSPIEIVCYIVGFAGVGYFFWKSRIDGFYPWEAATMWGAGGGSVSSPF